MEKKRYLLLALLIILFGTYLSTNTNACTPGTFEYGASCGRCATFRRDCQADCTWGGWFCEAGARIARDCTQYPIDVFAKIHNVTVQGLSDPNLDKNIRNQISGNIYYACPPDPRDSTCCPLSSCVFNGICHLNGAKLDIDNDRVREVCIAHSPGQWIDEFEFNCTDNIDDDLDGLADCNDPDCAGSIIGLVKNQDGQAVSSADISASKNLTTVASATTNQLGNYGINPINCGTYNLIASHPDYTPRTKINEILNPRQETISNFEESSALATGTSCEQDCTFVYDNIIHASCDTINGCAFYDSVSKAACDYSQPGWVRDYNETHYVVCAPGAPQPKVEIQASISCESGTLVKVTRIVLYNGKPVKLIVAACG